MKDVRDLHKINQAYSALTYGKGCQDEEDGKNIIKEIYRLSAFMHKNNDYCLQEFLRLVAISSYKEKITLTISEEYSLWFRKNGFIPFVEPKDMKEHFESYISWYVGSCSDIFVCNDLLNSENIKNSDPSIEDVRTFMEFYSEPDSDPLKRWAYWHIKNSTYGQN